MLSQSLAGLLPELVLMVMANLETPRDLLALVQTSKRNYQIFCATKKSILEAVIRNAIPPRVLPDAVAACEASQTPRLWWPHTPSRRLETPQIPNAAFRHSQEQFIELYPQRHITRVVDLRDLDLLLPLYKLWWIADSFLSDFRDRSFNCAANLIFSIGPGWNDNLSSNEKMRLQRAFYRFEIYRKLFPNTTGQRLEPTRADRELISRFLDLFSPLEREELISIQEYLVEVTKDIYRGLQKYTMERLRSMADERIKVCRDLNLTFEREEMYRIRSGFDLGGIDVFQESGINTPRRFQYIVARGLPFIRWLSHLPPNDRIFVVIDHLSWECSPSLFESVFHLDMELDLVDAAGLESPNEQLGWKWACADARMLGWKGMLRRYRLRKAGYVFWDTARLRHSWQLDKISPSMLRLRPRHEDDEDWDWYKGSSIEEAFKDIPVPKGAFRRNNEGAHLLFQASDALLATVQKSGFPKPFSEEEAVQFGIEY